MNSVLVVLPYGRGKLEAQLPDSSTHVAMSALPNGVGEAAKAIDETLDHPIGSPKLEELASSAGKISILITDRTRATPDGLILERVLRRLPRGRRDSVSVIVATGLHRPHSAEEMRELAGEEVFKEYRVMSHDAEDEANLLHLGRTSFGTEVEVNREVAQSDLVVAIGLIEPHFFAGYSGGRKMILAGVAGKRSIYHNHGYEMLSHPKADYGYLRGNPVSDDMVEASKMVSGYRFSVHVILDKEKRVVRAVAGDPYSSHEEGVRELDKYVKVPVPFEGDVVITTNGGHPLDRDLYQAVKGIVTGSRVAKRGGTVILASHCSDGVGHEDFRALASISRDPRKILAHIRENEPLRDQWQVQKLEQVLLRNRVIVVTKGVRHGVLEEMNLTPASSVEEALEVTCKGGNCGRTVVIPEGPYVIPYVGGTPRSEGYWIGKEGEGSSRGLGFIEASRSCSTPSPRASRGLVDPFFSTLG